MLFLSIFWKHKTSELSETKKHSQEFESFSKEKFSNGDPGFYTGLSDSRTKILITVHLVPVFNDSFVPLKYKCTPFGHIKLKFGHIRLIYIRGFVEYTQFFCTRVQEI